MAKINSNYTRASGVMFENQSVPESRSQPGEAEALRVRKEGDEGGI
jgi:hypothetical protein